MKQLIVLLAVCLSFGASSQAVNGDVYYSTNSTHIIGGDVRIILNNHFVVGVGGSHASQTFFTSEKHDGNEFMDKCYNQAPMPANLVKFDSFTENRGTLTGLVGYNLNKVILTVEGGLVFKQTVDLYTSANLASKPYPLGSNGWISHGSSDFCYGATISYNALNKWGVLVGYNNIQLLKFGVTYHIR